MKIVPINQKVAFVRHWGRWFRVLRAGEDWRPLAIGKQYTKPKTVKDITESLKSAKI
jgi:hypothetical protein